MVSLSDLVGQKFNRLTVLAPALHRRNGRYLLCRCDCGTAKEFLFTQIFHGKTRSCGCLRREVMRDSHTKHGHAGGSNRKMSRVYSIWHDMLRRCRDPRVKSYPRYGAVGITVCDRWLDFPAFLEDMGEPPTAKHSLDRINGKGNYEKSNCRWATNREQCRNKRNNRLFTWNGETLTVTEWAERTGLTKTAIASRLDHHWPAEEVLDPFRHKTGPKKKTP